MTRPGRPWCPDCHHWHADDDDCIIDAQTLIDTAREDRRFKRLSFAILCAMMLVLAGAMFLLGRLSVEGPMAHPPGEGRAIVHPNERNA